MTIQTSLISAPPGGVFIAPNDGLTDVTTALATMVANEQFIYIPAGTYKTTSPVALRSNQRIYGAGRTTTTVSFTGCSGFTSAASNEKISISDLKVAGNNTAGTYGLDVTNNPRGFCAERLAIASFGTAGTGGGIRLDGTGAQNMWGALLNQVEVEFCGRGIITNYDAATTLIACIARLNKGDCLFMSNSNRSAVLGGTFENAYSVQGATASIAVKLVDCHAVFVAGIYTENTIDAILQLDGSRECDIHLDGRWITNTSGTLCELKNSATHNKIRGALTGLISAGQTGISYDATSNDNDVDVTINVEGSTVGVVPGHAVVGTLVSDSGSGNSTRTRRGDNGVVSRSQSLTTFPDGIKLGAVTDVFAYEVSTFTPVFAFGTPGDSVITHTVQQGQYERIGRIVHFSLAVTFNTNAYSTASGLCTISGLPYTAKLNNTLFYYIAPMAGHLITYTAGTNYPVAAVISNTTTIQIWLQRSAGSFAQSSPAQFPASTTDAKLWISGTYQANS